MADTLVDRIAQAIGDPSSIVRRRFDADGDPIETVTRWGASAVLAVLAEDLRLPTAPAELEALTGPWQAVLSEHYGYVYGSYERALQRDGADSSEEYAVTVARRSALPVPVVAAEDDALRMPGSYRVGDVAHEQDDLYLVDTDDPTTAVAARLVQARAMAAGLNIAAAIAASEKD